MPEPTAWPFLIGRSRKDDYRFIVLPELVQDPSVIAALRAGTGGDPGRPGCALVREIKTPATGAGAVTAVYRVVEALGEDYGIRGGGLLTDAFGRPILLTEGLVIGGSASAAMASGLTQAALDLAHELVAPGLSALLDRGKRLYQGTRPPVRRARDSFPGRPADAAAGRPGYGAGPGGAR